jgi:hypothetical protein
LLYSKTSRRVVCLLTTDVAEKRDAAIVSGLILLFYPEDGGSRFL